MFDTRYRALMQGPDAETFDSVHVLLTFILGFFSLHFTPNLHSTIGFIAVAGSSAFYLGRAQPDNREIEGKAKGFGNQRRRNPLETRKKDIAATHYVTYT